MNARYSSRSLGGGNSNKRTSLSSLESLAANARTALNEAQYISPYSEWTSDELRDLLVMYQIPLRDSANTPHEMLVRICDEVFGSDIAESERPEIERRRLTIEEVIVMDRACRVIQKAFIRRKARRASSNYSHDEEYADYDYDVEGQETEHDGSISIHSSSSQSAQHDKLSSQPSNRHHSIHRSSILRRINERGSDYDEEINVAWRKPSWKFAKRHERTVRPHRAGKEMKPYKWRSVTLGRHCYAGGCGEQLDLWNEGRTSEFSQFGSGITNYFKVREVVV